MKILLVVNMVRSKLASMYLWVAWVLSETVASLTCLARRSACCRQYCTAVIVILLLACTRQYCVSVNRSDSLGQIESCYVALLQAGALIAIGLS